VIDTVLTTTRQTRPSVLWGLLEASLEADLAPDAHLPAQMLAQRARPGGGAESRCSPPPFYHAAEVEAFGQATVVVSKTSTPGLEATGRLCAPRVPMTWRMACSSSTQATATR